MMRQRTIESENFKKREVVGRGSSTLVGKNGSYAIAHGEDPEKWKPKEYDLTAPATPEAKQWEGWGTALKPAWEPIILAQSPLEGTYAENILKWKCGALNIDACRIRHSNDADLAESLLKNPGRHDTVTSGTYGRDRPQQSVNRQGRWPANFLLSHSVFCEKVGEKRVRGQIGRPNCIGKKYKTNTYGDGICRMKSHADPDGLETMEDWRCVPDCPVAILDGQSGVSKSPKTYKRSVGACNKNAYGEGIGQREVGSISTNYADQGGASRFFYCSKASRSERNAGLEGFESKGAGRWNRAGKWTDDTTPSANNHPTVKPIALLRYLCRLVTPPNGRILDPFAGSGSTGCAAALEGFEFIGVEKDAGYVEIARARLKHWEAQSKRG